MSGSEYRLTGVKMHDHAMVNQGQNPQEPDGRERAVGRERELI